MPSFDLNWLSTLNNTFMVYYSHSKYNKFDTHFSCKRKKLRKSYALMRKIFDKIKST